MITTPPCSGCALYRMARCYTCLTTRPNERRAQLWAAWLRDQGDDRPAEAVDAEAVILARLSRPGAGR